MIDNHFIPDQRIIDALNAHYGIKTTQLTELVLGADAHSKVYKAHADDNTVYFVKLKRGQLLDISTAILGMLQDAGIEHIIPPIKTRLGQPAQTIDDFTLLVYPFIEGQDGFTRALTDAQCVTLGEVLRQMHELPVPSSLQALIRRETYSDEWREIVRSLYRHIDANPVVVDEIASKLTLFMQQHRAEILRLVDRAEQLSQQIQAQPPAPFVFCHSDIHGGNVLIDKQDNIYIVDWDAPMTAPDAPAMAPKERDLMFIGAGIAHMWNKPHEIALFYQGYGRTEINNELLSYYRHERIVQDIALYGQRLLLSNSGGKERLVTYQHFIDQFEPNDVVEIAFKRDNNLP